MAQQCARFFVPNNSENVRRKMLQINVPDMMNQNQTQRFAQENRWRDWVAIEKK
jgi:hypothetical protein